MTNHKFGGGSKYFGGGRVYKFMVPVLRKNI